MTKLLVLSSQLLPSSSSYCRSIQDNLFSFFPLLRALCRHFSLFTPSGFFYQIRKVLVEKVPREETMSRVEKIRGNVAEILKRVFKQFVRQPIRRTSSRWIKSFREQVVARKQIFQDIGCQPCYICVLFITGGGGGCVNEYFSTSWNVDRKLINNITF